LSNKTKRFILPEEEIPHYWYNIQADMVNKPMPPLNPFMKLYHKFFLYQNKWIHPYIRVALGVMTVLTYLASILLIVGLVYEHGFTISAAEAHQLQRLYHGVWIVFLVDISLHILLEYKDTRQTFSTLTWILTFLLYLTLVPVVFHRPEVEGAVQAVWDFLNGKAYHLVLLLVLSFLNLSYGLVRLLGRRTALVEINSESTHEMPATVERGSISNPVPMSMIMKKLTARISEGFVPG